MGENLPYNYESKKLQHDAKSLFGVLVNGNARSIHVKQNYSTIQQI